MSRTGKFFLSVLIALMTYAQPDTGIAGGASKEQIRTLIEWIPTGGEPANIDYLIARALSIRVLDQGQDLPVIQKGFNVTPPGTYYVSSLAMVNGRPEVILQRWLDGKTMAGSDYYAWRVSEVGEVKSTVRIPKDGNAIFKDILLYEKEFESTLAFLLERVSEKPK